MCIRLVKTKNNSREFEGFRGISRDFEAGSSAMQPDLILPPQPSQGKNKNPHRFYNKLKCNQISYYLHSPTGTKNKTNLHVYKAGLVKTKNNSREFEGFRGISRDFEGFRGHFEAISRPLQRAFFPIPIPNFYFFFKPVCFFNSDPKCSKQFKTQSVFF